MAHGFMSPCIMTFALRAGCWAFRTTRLDLARMWTPWTPGLSMIHETVIHGGSILESDTHSVVCFTSLYVRIGATAVRGRVVSRNFVGAGATARL